MKKEKIKKADKAFLEHSFHEMAGAKRELSTSYREGSAFFIGIFLFLCGFLFNLTASIVYDLVKDNHGMRILILFATTLSLIFLVLLIRKYILVPIVKQKEKLEKYKKEAQMAVHHMVTMHDDFNGKW